MKKLIGSALIASTIALSLAPAHVLAQAEVKVEKKTTTTNPSGTVVVQNESSRTFTLQGQTQVYTAPSDVDLKTYTGKEVTVTVDPQGNVTKMEKKTTTTSP